MYNKIVIDINDNVSTVSYEGSNITYPIVKLDNITGKFEIDNRVADSIISLISKTLLEYGKSIRYALKNKVSLT